MEISVIIFIGIIIFLLMFILRLLFLPLLIIGIVIYLIHRFSRNYSTPIYKDEKKQDDVLNAEYTEKVED